MIAQVPQAWSGGSQAISGAIPASLPEPGGLALFAIIAGASAMKLGVRRLRSRVAITH
jgi:hypothetical protein